MNDVLARKQYGRLIITTHFDLQRNPCPAFPRERVTKLLHCCTGTDVTACPEITRNRSKTLSLSAQERYQYFLDHIAEHPGVWSLSDDEGIAVSETEDGKSCFNVWPLDIFARRCAVGDWGGYSPEPIPTDSFIAEWLPDLAEAGIMISVFPAPEGNSVELSAIDLRNELLNARNSNE